MRFQIFSVILYLEFNTQYLSAECLKTQLNIRIDWNY